MTKNQEAQMPGKPGILQSLNKVRVYIKKYQNILIIAIILVLVSTLLSLTGPYLVKLMGDQITNGIIITSISPLEGYYDFDLSVVVRYATIIVVIYSISFLTSIINSLLFNHITQKSSQTMRNSIAVKINKLPLQYFDTTSQGDIISRVTNDVDTLATALNNNLAHLISSFTTVIGSIVIMFILSWQIALVVLALIPVTIIFTRIIMKRSQKYFIGYQKDLGAASGYVEETFTGQKIISSYNAEEKRQTEFNKISLKIKENGWKSQFFSGTLFPLVNFVGNLAFVFACVIGGILVVKGSLTAAAIPIFAIYIRMFNQSIGRIGQNMTEVLSAGAASERVFEFLNAVEMQDESFKAKRLERHEITGRVEFHNVKFGYDSSRTIINDFTAYAKPGQKIAIVGPTGAGKTTIVNLLMRFYDINEGDITIDGTSIYDLNRKNIRELFGMVLQDTWLFTGTILENLTYGKADATFEEVQSACRTANVDHFIESLPNGYNNILDENADISQGQKQLLTIARAMIQDAPMLILDEATSNVDTRTELLIQEAMDNLMKGRTTFVIAHRLSTIKNSNLILVMSDGNIVEKGTHEELMHSQSGLYKELYNSQFEQDMD